MTIEELLSLLHSVKPQGPNHWKALCPGHNDTDPSLDIKVVGDKILLHCMASCNLQNVLSALEITLADLYTTPKQTTTTKRTIIATYQYIDANSKPFEVVRTDPKSFYQRQPDDKGGYINTLKGIETTLYHQDRLQEAMEARQSIFIAEGEKDVDALWGLGFAATTNPMGAGKWRDQYSETLRGADAIIIPDNDAPGLTHAKAVALSLYGKAGRIRILHLHSEIKDISDWLAMDGNIDHFDAMIAAAKDFSLLVAGTREYDLFDDTMRREAPEIIGLSVGFEATNIRRERTGIHSRVSILAKKEGGAEFSLAWTTLNIERDEDRTRLSNSAHSRLGEDDGKVYTKKDLKRDLDEFCEGLWSAHIGQMLPEPVFGDYQPISFLLEPFIVEGGGTILYAPPGAGKSNTALAIAVSIDAGTNNLWHVKQTPTAFINLERSAQSLKNRLGAVNVALGLPRNRPLIMLNARGHSFSDLVDNIKVAKKKYGIGFMVLDSISRGGFGDLNDNQPINRAIDTLNNLSHTWLALGHTPRSDESHVFGGVHHEAGADIMVELTRQQDAEANKLGIGLEITKANDVGIRPKIRLALEFGDRGLIAIRKADSHEFVKLDMKRKPDMKDAIMDYLLEAGDATASDLSKELGFNRANISTMLRHDGGFVLTRKEGRSTYYGVAIH